MDALESQDSSLTTQPPRSYTRLAIAVIVAGVVIGAGIFASSYLGAATTVTRTSLETTTMFTTMLVSSSTTSVQTETSNSGVSTTCVINAEGELIVKVLNSSNGEPIGSVPFQVEYLYPYCPPNPHTIQDLGTMKTNASGIILLGGLGEYYLAINDFGYRFGTYSVNASIGAETTTCVTIGIPSGDLSISYSQPFQTSCSTPSMGN
jgi:hypothetical protein